MSRTSTATVRDRPVRDTTSSSAAGLLARSDTLVIETRDRLELIDLTDRLLALVRECGVREGFVNVWSMHTTCALFINEHQTALLADIKEFLERTVVRDAPYRHNDPEYSDCDRMNADSHLRALLLGHSLTLQVSGGELVLGQWQRILAAELDGPRARSLRVQVIGLA